MEGNAAHIVVVATSLRALEPSTGRSIHVVDMQRQRTVWCGRCVEGNGRVLQSRRTLGKNQREYREYAEK